MSTYDYAIVDLDAVIFPLGFAAASKGLAWEEVKDAFAFRTFQLNRLADKTCFIYTVPGGPKYRDQFRNHVAYKSTRKKSGIKPLYIDDMHHFTEDAYLLNSRAALPNLGEADDYICAFAAECAQLDYSYVVVHTDKDLNQIPGVHVDITGNNPYHVTNIQADRFKYQQILSGDRADDIPGLRGYGPARAKQVLVHAKSEREMYERSFREYVKVLSKDFSDEEIAEYYYETANLVHLRRNLIDDQWEIPNA